MGFQQSRHLNSGQRAPKSAAEKFMGKAAEKGILSPIEHHAATSDLPRSQALGAVWSARFILPP